jgi:D-serine deaminase-like pyridoxal phosphate-dependent protein
LSIDALEQPCVRRIPACARTMRQNKKLGRFFRSAGPEIALEIEMAAAPHREGFLLVAPAEDTSLCST